MQLEIRAGLLAGVATLMAQFAWAQTPVGNASQAGPMSPAYCKQSTMTADQFMQLVKDIMRHGDLTDIPFLERTFRTKFTVNQLDYRSGQMLGAPIQVDIHRANLGTWVSIGTEVVPPTEHGFLQECLHLSKDDMYSTFGPGFRSLPPPLALMPLPGHSYDIPTTKDVFKYFNDTNGAGYRFDLSFTYDLANLDVTRVAIGERK
jgi:hypothetical protein